MFRGAVSFDPFETHLGVPMQMQVGVYLCCTEGAQVPYTTMFRTFSCNTLRCLGCGEVRTYHSHKFALLANRIFLALGGGTADILQHCRIVVHRRMFPRHLWQSRFDNDASNVGSSGRKCEFYVGCTYARQPRFSHTLNK